MADSLITIADMVKINDVSIRDMGATEIFNDAPVISQLNAIEASHGNVHKFTKETAAPTVGFRAAGEGRDHSKSGDTNVSVDLAILDASWHVEAAIAASNPRGRDFVVAREGSRHLRAAFSHGEKQLFYGTGADSGGFPGLADDAALSNADSSMVVNAGGTAGSGVQLTDVWMFRTTSDERFVNAVVGHEGNLDIGDVYEQMLDGSNDKKRNCLVQAIEGWMGLAIESSKAIARLVNLNDGANKLTDDLLSSLFEKFDENNPPTHIVMNKRSRRQLQQSRTATNATGAPAPWPDSWEGIPIISAKSIPTYTTAVADA
ncbi:MAG: hypothetical protein Aurels2KO_25350 [Aureliella sp.]